jgi:hypothetical protein
MYVLMGFFWDGLSLREVVKHCSDSFTMIDENGIGSGVLLLPKIGNEQV